MVIQSKEESLVTISYFYYLYNYEEYYYFILYRIEMSRL